MFVLFALSFVDYMCILRNGELYPLMNLTVYATTLVITLVENVKLGYGFMY